ncbi:MAG: hypothetical protein IKR28_09965 [Selenomonadaceae bacterium]|nr:hypothetical protein [Selenomonadaceae bacterium]
MKGSSMIPPEEITEIKNYIKGQLAAAGGNIKVAVDRMNEAYNGRKEYYPTTTTQVNEGTLPYWKAVRMAKVMGYEIKWVKITKE